MSLEEKRACLWHAFDALDGHKTGTGLKSQLKVLTHNIATSLGITRAEEGLEDYRSTNSINFSDYLHFLKIELFAQILQTKEENANTCLDKIDEVCWLVCAKKYSIPNSLVSDEDRYKLWRIFNCLAETESNGDVICPLVVDVEEILLLIQKFFGHIGGTYLTTDYEDLCETYHVGFGTFLSVICERCSKGVDSELVGVAIQDLYEEYILQVIKKGQLLKKGHDMMSTWRERWFVLTHQSLKYYATSEEKDLKGTILFTPTMKIENIMEKSGARPFRFQLVLEGRTYEMSAPDAKTRTEWSAGLRLAIDRCTTSQSKQQEAFQKRRASRTLLRSKAQLEQEKRKKDMQLFEEQKAQLDAEKTAREEIEAKFNAEVAAREAEAARRQELEDAQTQLQELLVEERQAKRDEEIVRNLQARILAEQFEKSDELEKLKKSMEDELKQERQKRENLEEFKMQQEQLMEEKQKQLEELAKSRRAADEQLYEALEKLQVAEKAKSELQQKIENSDSSCIGLRGRSKSEDPSTLQIHLSHRGKGAFSVEDFLPVGRSNSQSNILDHDDFAPR